ncbi:hypothetical protein POSPLADRAFT_1048097 [Postia placenta MAD-698-R-SB12]|uniref:Glucose-methanol-choline oxidoreductase N-terminal domain-containing protein n=1 Tax=Postia placenta MAD-698-R-SB12 TaxID=670580 RepID=A0A1X6MWG6_9APHY|nr:hypothetical protein POSPLADRAFT_1048097 [Postia placenta MAD-698-R-SB12]OSX60725.1 hypothetical protein POSPLADRAFT_1048097 [Postia placenta MAD-698-R-SB12]
MRFDNMSTWFRAYPRQSVDELEDAYDYIVVGPSVLGGGTAGCVLANRLSQDASVSVLVTERGGVNNGWITRIPFLSMQFVLGGLSTRIWKSVPQNGMNDRVFELAGGHSLGGASKVNVMLYTRGVPGEYNSWSQAGRDGWSYDEIQPYFTRSETDLDQDRANPPSFHGVKGGIIRASKALGIPYVDDLNSPLHSSHGCAKMHYTIDAKGYRSSTLEAFLPKKLVIQRRQHLHICTNAAVTRIDIQRDEKGGMTANGVYIQSTKANTTRLRLVRARKEVILSAGPIGSPQVLMLSGIGPDEQLKEHGIPIVKSLASVGRHLQDHIGIAVQYRVPLKDSLAKLQLQPWIILKELLLYILFGMGLFLAPFLELSIFVQTRLFDSNSKTVTQTPADEDAALPMNMPDIEVMPIAWSDAATSKSSTRDGGLGFLVIILRPTSTGTVRLASSDPLADPLVDPNYYATEHDRAVLRQGIRFTLRLHEQLVAQDYPAHPYLVPTSESDEDIDAFVRAYSQTTYHYSSTCRMAPEVPGSTMGGVVDDRLRVHGVRGLRVADSSVFPHILSTHLAAATVAVAEKCSDMVKEDNSSA